MTDSVLNTVGTEMLLDVRDLRVSFDKKRVASNVVKGIDFAMARSETVAIVGESGSGKSMTAMAIMRLLKQHNVRIGGEVRFDGVDLLTLPETDMQRLRGNEVAMIFQEPMTSLNPLLTVGLQVSEALVRHSGLSRKAALDEAARLMDRVRIPDARRRIHDYPHQFSGGMRQRVMIAMALACKPKLLIADEPTTALDVTIQAQILDLIKEIQAEEGTAVLFITHDMGVVAEISDRTLVMYRGDIVESGSTADIFHRPAQPYTQALLSAVPELGSMRDLARPQRFVIAGTAEAATPAAPVVTPATEATVPDTGKVAVEISNLTTRFDIRGPLGTLVGRVHAVENVSLQVNRGETLAIVGESGCGKSTLARSLLGIAPISAGRITVAGHDVRIGRDGLSQAARHGVQMIFQDPYASLNPRIRVGEAIAEPLVAQKLAKPREALDRARALLGQVGLEPGMADRLPHEFSGGQRQRVCLARALATSPGLVVADEAVSALDVSVKAQIMNLMLELQEDLGLSYLFVSHDMAVVERVSHRVAVMYLGEIVEYGPRQAVFNDPRHPYTKRLLSAVPVADPSRRRVRHGLGDDEVRSPVRPLDYEPPRKTYREYAPGHFAQEWEAHWPVA